MELFFEIKDGRFSFRNANGAGWTGLCFGLNGDCIGTRGR